jgi:hypothetical protein
MRIIAIMAGNERCRNKSVTIKMTPTISATITAFWGSRAKKMGVKKSRYDNISGISVITKDQDRK